MKLHIGLSYAPASKPKYGKYSLALQRAAGALGYELEVSDLFDHPELAKLIDGILFTGGADVAPALYGKPELDNLCDVDPERDEKEFAFAQEADERGLPIFGICRGLQLLNVHYGGTLVADLERSGVPSHSKINGDDRRHVIHAEPGRLMKKISGVAEGSVTSAHHQAIDALAPGMVISARSTEDNVIEAIEWDDQSGKPYFLAVQWHPERMEYNEELAGRLFESFLENVAMSKILSQRIKRKTQ
ncbi:MAG: gamma-glutamyl-gamma-aminobutyrate hydrolase family protein [Ignavibacteriota bacterium]